MVYFISWSGYNRHKRMKIKICGKRHSHCKICRPDLADAAHFASLLPPALARSREAGKRAMESEADRQQQSERMRQLWSDPEWHQEVSSRMKRYPDGCDIEYCAKKYAAKDLCALHYSSFIATPRRRALKMGAPSDLTVKQWRAKLAAYGNHCAYCGVWSKALTQDHIRPLSKGGHHTASNIVPACKSCNSRKSDSVNKYLPMSPSVISACFSLAL